jgi:hypothetical protein
MAKLETLEAELAAEQQRSTGHRADFERERERAYWLMTELLSRAVELMTAREVTGRLEGELAALRSRRRRWWQRRAA